PSSGTNASTLDLEFQWMTGPFSLLAEYYDRTTDPAGGVADQDDDGYTLQAGCFLVPKVWEAVARFSQVDQTNAPILGAAAVKQNETTFGIDRYIDGHNGKWMFDYVMLDNE